MNTAPKPSAPLSPREREVAALIAKDYSTREISELLGTTYHTVKEQRDRISLKLGGGIAVITLWAVKEGLVIP